MKFARFWPTTASLLGVGLLYVVLAQADSSAPPKPPQPYDPPHEHAQTQPSPSDLPRLECADLLICPTANKACATGECPSACAPCATVAGTICSPACPPCGNNPAMSAFATACKSVCQAAACGGTPSCNGTATCKSSCGEWKAKTVAACACGQKCACDQGCACGQKCACDKGCACGEACACGAHSAPPGVVCHDPYGGNFDFPPHPDMLLLGPPPHMSFPPPYMPPHAAPHPHMHNQLVEAMMENARLRARDEAWVELQRRSEHTAQLAIENAQLKAQLELATHKEKALEQVAKVLEQNATLTAKLEAVEERQGLMEAMMKLAAENARLETAVEVMENQFEMHAEMLNSIVEAKEELMAPLYEALVENASLKAAAEAEHETHTLQSRVAELEQLLRKLAADKGHSAPTVKTAEKPTAESETK